MVRALFFKVTVLLLWSLVSQASQLSVVTYNVWFDSATATERIPKLLDIVAKKKADIIAFQEVESWFIDALESDDRFKDYHFAMETGWFNSVKGGLLVLTKTEKVQQQYMDLPSHMSRGLLQVIAKIDGVQVCIVTVHLDSMLNDTELRINQLKVVTQQTSKCNNLILLGDFNYGDGEAENNAINSDYKDVWKQLRPNYRGYTWDVTESNLAKRNSFPSEGSRRLDKVFVKGTFLMANTIEIIGKMAFISSTGRRLFPSDHFGLSVVFDTENKILEN